MLKDPFNRESKCDDCICFDDVSNENGVTTLKSARGDILIQSPPEPPKSGLLSETETLQGMLDVVSDCLEKLKTEDEVVEDVEYTVCVPDDFPTVNEAITYLGNLPNPDYGIRPKILVDFDNYTPFNDVIFGLDCPFDIEPKNPTPIPDFDSYPKRDLVCVGQVLPSDYDYPVPVAVITTSLDAAQASSINSLNNARDKADCIARIRADFPVMEYDSGSAIQLNGKQIGLIKGIGFIGTSDVDCIDGGGGGPRSGAGSNCFLDNVAICGFHIGYTSQYGARLHATDKGLWIGYCRTNAQIQYSGDYFAKGSWLIGAEIYNLFVKRGGLGYVSQNDDDEQPDGFIQANISHALSSNVRVNGAGVCHLGNAALGPCDGPSIFVDEGGYVNAKDSTIDGAFGDGVRNFGGVINLDGATIKNSGVFAIRHAFGDTILKSTVIEDNGQKATDSSLLLAICGNVDLGNDSFKSTFRTNVGAIQNQGANVTGSAIFEQSPSHIAGDTIGTFVRHEGGVTDVNYDFVNKSTASTGSVFTTQTAYGSVRLKQCANAVGDMLDISDFRISNRDQSSAIPATIFPIGQGETLNQWISGTDLEVLHSI